MLEGTPWDRDEYEYAIQSRVMMGHPPIGPLTQAQHDEEVGLEAYYASMENECGNSISTGGFDPYGTHCDLQHGHTGPHEGSDYFGEGRMTWTGGGSCAGDPLPVHIIEHTEA
jgi:hypothetical protein